MGSEVLDVLSFIPETLEKMLIFPSTRGHHGDSGGPGSRGSSPSSPLSLPVDIVESSAEYTFLLDVPGLSKSDLQVPK